MLKRKPNGNYSQPKYNIKKKCRKLTIINKAEKLLLKEKLNDA